jgi:putative membrane protein
MPYHPYYDNGGTHWGLWIVMIVAMLIFFAILAWAVVSLVRQRDAHARAGTPLPPAAGSDPFRILDERLARGEIDTDEYTRRRDLLKANGAASEAG